MSWEKAVRRGGGRKTGRGGLKSEKPRPTQAWRSDTVTRKRKTGQSRRAVMRVERRTLKRHDRDGNFSQRHFKTCGGGIHTVPANIRRTAKHRVRRATVQTPAFGPALLPSATASKALREIPRPHGPLADTRFKRSAFPTRDHRNKTGKQRGVEFSICRPRTSCSPALFSAPPAASASRPRLATQ